MSVWISVRSAFTRDNIVQNLAWLLLYAAFNLVWPMVTRAFGGVSLWYLIPLGSVAFLVGAAVILLWHQRSPVATDNRDMNELIRQEYKRTKKQSERELRGLDKYTQGVLSDLRDAERELRRVFGDWQKLIPLDRELENWAREKQSLWQRAAAEMFGEGMKGAGDPRLEIPALAAKVDPARPDANDALIERISAAIGLCVQTILERHKAEATDRPSGAVGSHDLVLSAIDCDFTVTDAGTRARYSLVLTNESRAKLQFFVRRLRASLNETAIQYAAPTSQWNAVIGSGKEARFHFPDIEGVSHDGKLTGSIDVRIDYGGVGEPPRYQNEKQIDLTLLRRGPDEMPSAVDYTLALDEHRELY